MEACTSHAYLLQDILSLIFEHLPLEDRKAVRLTCKAWSNASKSVSITKHEKLVLRPHYPNIIRTISASNSTQFNLQFQGRRIDKLLSVSFWRKCGSRIRTLEFYSCRLNLEVLENIIMHCDNLTSLSVICNLGGTRSNFDVLVHALNYFIEKGVTNTQVNALRIEEKAPVSVSVTDVLRKAILVFPCIQSFKVYLSCEEESQIEEEVSLHSISQLRSFAYFNLYLKYFFVLDESIRMFPSSLMEFETKIPKTMDATRAEETLLKFFSTQENLRVVKLDVEREATLLKKLAFFLLENCRNLRELIMGCGSEVELSSSEATKLLDSITTLQRLQFECSLTLPATWMSSPRNLALSRLYFHDSPEANNFFCTLLAGCRKVKFLYCNAPSDSVLEKIFENLINLRALTLLQCNRHSKFGFTNRNGTDEYHHSIHRLKNLKFLIIYGGQMRYLPSNGLKFQMMRHLDISALPLPESFNKLCQVVWSMPMLQYLEVHSIYYDGDMYEVIELCQPMKYLQCLYFNVASDAIYFDFDFRKLFERCPSLRYVITEQGVFLYNPFTSRITKCSKDNFDFPVFVK